MIWYHVRLVLMVLTACILQQFSPAFESVHEARILVVPLVFLCSAVTINVGPMLLLAFLCGFLWDAQHILGEHGGLGAVAGHVRDEERHVAVGVHVYVDEVPAELLPRIDAKREGRVLGPRLRRRQKPVRPAQRLTLSEWRKRQIDELVTLIQ